MNEKELKEPTYPKRDDFYSDKQYLDAIGTFKRQRRQWINQNKEKDPLVTKSIVLRKEKKKYRTMKESQFRKEQEARIKQRKL